MIRRHRYAHVVAAAAVAMVIASAPGWAATPGHSDVSPDGTSGFGPTASWAGGNIVGNPDPNGPPAPGCPPGCDRETFTVAAAAGYTAGNVINVTATATFAAGTSNGSADISILDSSNTVLAQTTGATSPAAVTASDLLPGNYVVEVDGDIGDPADTSYQGSLSVTHSARVALTGHPDGGITGSRETVADPFRLGTEPTIAVSPDGTLYEGPIFGFSTTQSFLQRSDHNGAYLGTANDGQTFNTLGVPGVGKNTTCGGGGDLDISTDPHNNLYFLDLGGEPSVPAAVSADHGNSFTDNCVANDVATTPGKPNSFPDRQWLSTDTIHGVEWFIWRDGLISPPGTPLDSTAGPVYGEYIESAPLASGMNAGASQLLYTHLCKNTSGTLGVPCITDVAIAGNAVTNNAIGSTGAGNTYLAMTGHGGVGVAVINPTATTPVVERTAVPGSGAVLFPTVGVDKAGNVYEAYTDASSFQLVFTMSADAGATWTAPVAINGAPAAVTAMPWIVAGDTGKVDIVFYGSANTHAPTTNSGPWNVYMLQNLTANTSQAFSAWTQARLTDRPNHVDPICLSGLGCTTNLGPAGDRELGDFFRVALDADGRAVVSFADGNNQLGQEVAAGGPVASPSFAQFLRQATGPSLYNSVGTVPGIPLPTNSVSVGAHSDPIPNTTTACDPNPPTVTCPNDDALNVLSSTASSDGTSVHIQLTIKNMTATPPPTALAFSTFLTRWWFNGHIYFAAAEVPSPAEGTPAAYRFYGGNAAPVSDGLAIKYAYYPASTSVSATGTANPGANTIDITVPAANVGNPTATDTLYSVTSYTTSHAAATATAPPTAANFTDFPQIVDVLPAYNVVPQSPIIPEAPWTTLLIVVGMVTLAFGTLGRRRRTTRTA